MSYISDIGLERARQHIREAEQLSRELGGTDKDVKKYFFSLPRPELKQILDDYEREFGRSPREYAEQTLPRWKSGQRKMSGMVATRLYSLLPPRMPLETKYSLVKTLWGEYSPRSYKILRIGPDATEKQVIEAVRDHIFSTIDNYEIPLLLGNRFRWLTKGDVAVQQQLLNHFLDLEKEEAVSLTKYQLPVMLKHLRQSGDEIHRLNQSIEIGHHQFDLNFDPNAIGIKLEEPKIVGSLSSGSNWQWLWWVVGIGIALLIFFG